MTSRVNFKKKPFDVYIGRGGKWGNPFPIRSDRSREKAVSLYETWIKTQPQLISSLHELDGKILGCYCDEDQMCHGDVLIKLIEEQKTKES